MGYWEEYEKNVGKSIIMRLHENGMIKTYKNKPEGWRLAGGQWSPFYINLRLLPSYPETFASVGSVLGQLIKEECPGVNRVVGVAMAGIPITAAIAVKAGIPSCYTRKLEGVKSEQDFNKRIKEYGEHSMVEGVIENGDRLAIVDDLVTKFDSKEIALAQLEFELELRGLDDVKCEDVVVLFDREQGAEQSAREKGIALHSLISFKSKGIDWLSEVLSKEETTVINDYLENPKKYQNVEIQQELKQEAETRRSR